MHTLCTYCQLHTFLHFFFSPTGKQYQLWFNFRPSQSTSVSTVHTVVYSGSDNSMCKLSLIDRGLIFTTVYPYMNSKIGCLHWSLFTSICFFRFAVLKVEKLHWSHLLGFTPMCIVRLAAWAVSSLHWSHLLDFPPLCTMYILKPCTLFAYQGPTDSKGKLLSFLQLIILQLGKRFPIIIGLNQPRSEDLKQATSLLRIAYNFNCI